MGDRIRIYGGYDINPAWMRGHDDGYVGTVVEFIPGQNEQPAVVVDLDEELVLPDGAGAVSNRVAGRFLVLELGHVGTDWATVTPRIHVELCTERPQHQRWQDRGRGAWIESHATYERHGG